MIVFLQLVLELLKAIPWQVLPPEIALATALTALTALIACLHVWLDRHAQQKSSPANVPMVIFDRRTGPADRRAVAGGGRRRTDGPACQRHRAG